MQNGNSLIEVLVSLVLMSVILGGAQALLLRAKQYQHFAQSNENEWVQTLQKTETLRVIAD